MLEISDFLSSSFFLLPPEGFEPTHLGGFSERTDDRFFLDFATPVRLRTCPGFSFLSTCFYLSCFLTLFPSFSLIRHPFFSFDRDIFPNSLF